MPHLFSELKIHDITFANRIGVSPMCQYSCTDGLANDWHFVHLATRAVGGAGLVFTEAAAVTPEGRISPQDIGIWSDSHAEALARITHFIDAQGSVAGIQLAHAGRKASTYRPWSGDGAVPVDQGGWTPLGPSALAFAENYAVPRELTADEIQSLQQAFVAAAQRAFAVGFRVLELHAAHGYLFHEFLSPLSNRRSDSYGGSFENRTRFLRDTVSALRRTLPERCVLFVRISATDWVEKGWDIEESIELARQLKTLGVDVIDCSTGGNVARASIPVGPGYQTSFAERIRREADILTATVGMISAPVQADHVIRTGQADMVLLARELLREPYWPLHAARELGQTMPWPAQYLRAAPRGTPERCPAHEID
ncbi:NADH:flavin oxidoreductase/NADH oxidase [Dongia soli]|uniref:NADH:flavin oxidoreductase/NADH oxidase n=1 Tax=Dongia soli TaxID=600628 RepID=A0ABU5EFE5_9PROT|nr:NADH:flavin oxidoreductase/NADH oxidase [Dongia soli]MDY0884936.1 NADH:flavin oxidoreductase/NADH oxidase [Dongia soli]